MRQKQSLFEELLLPHLDGAYNLARWIVERDQVAQAVVQEAYIQALKEFVEFRGADARAWLLTIIRNTAYTWIQKHGNHSNMISFDETTHVAPSDKPLPEPSPEEMQRHLHQALSKLPVEFREVLVLREIEGWSYKQLASALNVSAATVMSLSGTPTTTTTRTIIPTMTTDRLTITSIGTIWLCLWAFWKATRF
jgi:RNA polymerase sigma factor (sigma-70 family)